MGTINNLVIPIIIDSGANSSFISESLCKTLKCKINSQTNRIFSVNNSLMSLGRINANLVLGEISEETEFLVIPNMKYPVILGLDNFRRYKLNISENLEVVQNSHLRTKFQNYCAKLL